MRSTGLSETPETGEVLHITAHVALGDLSPNDVEVQVVYGKVSEADMITGDKKSEALHFVESYPGGRHKFEGEIRLRRTGSFGYTVRVLPYHAGLVSPAEMGRVANA